MGAEIVHSAGEAHVSALRDGLILDLSQEDGVPGHHAWRGTEEEESAEDGTHCKGGGGSVWDVRGVEEKG